MSELGESLNTIVGRFESILEQMLVRSEEESFRRESIEDQQKLKRELEKKGVFFISDKRTQLVPKRELSTFLRSNLGNWWSTRSTLFARARRKRK